LVYPTPFASSTVLSASAGLPSATASAAGGWLNILGIDAKGGEKSRRPWRSDLGGAHDVYSLRCCHS
jgi:hypothetical protein